MMPALADNGRHQATNTQSLPKSSKAPSKTTKTSQNWADLPGWQGLPREDLENFKNENKINDAAAELYNRAYRQMLVGDLETAEIQFKRLMLHYQSSPIAAKAKQQLSRIYSEKSLAKTSEKDGKAPLQGESPNSTIQQFSIISRSHPFQPDATKNKQNTNKDLQKNGISNGTIDDFIMNVGDRIFFDKGSDKLSPESKSLLKAQANWLKKNNKYRLVIEGHAHEDGSKNDNYKLAKERAKNVTDFFISLGIGPKRIEMQSYGSEKPIALCKENKCFAQNRRVVTRLSARIK
ncbi:MAG: OmpA family protein [Pseudomonadota bacterium]